MQVIIDRFEGDYAVVELPDGTFVDMPRILLEDANEQDIIDITINTNETKTRRNKMDNLMNSLFID